MKAEGILLLGPPEVQTLLSLGECIAAVEQAFRFQCALMGDLHHALDAGVVSKTDVYAELGEIAAESKPGRESAEEITVFDSTGVALQDITAAAILYEKAERHGFGIRLSLAG